MSAVADIRPFADASRPGRPVNQWQVVRSEWIKFWSLRSTRWSMGLGILGLLLGIAVCEIDMARWIHLPLSTRTDYPSVDNVLIGWHPSELAIGVLGVLVISGEYGTGMIRSTFMAVPRRLPVLWAKIGVFASITFVFSVPVSFIGFLGALAVLTQHHVDPSLASPHALRCVIAIPLFLAVLAVFTVALGALFRDTAGGIACFAAIIFVIPGLVGVLSANLKNAINPYLPCNAASA